MQPVISTPDEQAIARSYYRTQVLACLHLHKVKAWLREQPQKTAICHQVDPKYDLFAEYLRYATGRRHVVNLCAIRGVSPEGITYTFPTPYWVELSIMALTNWCARHPVQVWQNAKLYYDNQHGRLWPEQALQALLDEEIRHAANIIPRIDWDKVLDSFNTQLLS